MKCFTTFIFVFREKVGKGNINRPFRLNTCNWSWKLRKSADGGIEGNQKVVCYESYQEGIGHR